jgi:hypothetical protein
MLMFERLQIYFGADFCVGVGLRKKNVPCSSPNPNRLAFNIF